MKRVILPAFFVSLPSESRTPRPPNSIRRVWAIASSLAGSILAEPI